MILRLGWHVAIPYGVHLWIDPQPLGDIPLSQLTLNMIFSNLFAGALAIGALYHFFNFPDTPNSEIVDVEPSQKREIDILVLKSNPYVDWVKGSVGMIFILIFVVAWMET